MATTYYSWTENGKTMYYFPDGRDGDPPDWNKINDGQKIITVLNALHRAGIKRQLYFDIRELFINFPKLQEQTTPNLKANINFGKVSVPVMMNIAVWKDMKTQTNYIRTDQVMHSNESYWQVWEHKQYLNNGKRGFERLWISVPNRFYYIVYDFLYP